MIETKDEKRIQPGARSFFMVVRLLGEALLDIVLLPLRLVCFLCTRKKTVSHIEKLLRNQNPSSED